jgi:hypothetical protein
MIEQPLHLVLQLEEQPADHSIVKAEVSDPTQSCEGTPQSRSFGNAMKTAAGISNKHCQTVVKKKSLFLLKHQQNSLKKRQNPFWTRLLRA